MARGKRQEILTLEERLQTALVPESEQPYKVPGNWCWVRVSSVCEFERGITFPASAKEKKPTNTNIPCLRTANVQDKLEIDDLIYVDKAYMKGNEAKLVQKDDIIMSSANSRELVGKTSYVHDVPFPMTFGGFVLTIRTKTIISKYLFYFLRLEFLSGHFMGESTQTTNIANINTTKLGRYALSLSPLAEQQRIVDRIESLFAKLDEAKQKAQDVLDSFETRKAAILHKAFVGELTAQWRKEYGVGMESWERANLGEYVDSQYGYTESASQKQVGPKFLRITDIQDGIVNWADVPFCKISDTDFERYAVSKNDIVIARTGATTGKSYLIVDDVKAVFASYLIRIKIKSPELQPQYLYAFMQSQMYWGQITEFSAGIAQPGVNAKKLKEIMLPIPPVPEQVEIVRILDSLLAKEQQAKEAAEGVLEQIDLIKKAILARAFRGELGTNDPCEENAIKLLEQYFSETIESKKVRHKQVARQKAEVIFVPKTIMEVLSTGVRLTPENLKRETELSIDDFYAQLKGLIDNGSVIESRENGESYLEAANEDRQAKNQ